MIINDRLGLIKTWHMIWRDVCVLFLLDVVVTVAYVGMEWKWIAPSEMPLPLIGAGLAVILGLRNNTAYARWWEARTLWGSVVNYSRSVVRANATLMPQKDAEDLRLSIGIRQVAWVHALRSHLRRQDPWEDLNRLLPESDLNFLHTVDNIPFALQMEIALEINEAQKRGYLDSIQVAAMNGILNELSNAQGGLERIRNTPMPRQYTFFPRVFVGVYCIMLPFGIVPHMLWATPLGSTILGCLFLALEALGRQLESPFDRTVHDVPMSAITRTIEIDLRQSLNAIDNLPQPLRAVHGVLN
jgi:putative membrane protein